MRVETGLMTKIRAFRKEVSESSHALPPLDDTGRRQAFYEQVVPHQTPNWLVPSFSTFQTPELWEISLFLESPTPWYYCPSSLDTYIVKEYSSLSRGRKKMNCSQRNLGSDPNITTYYLCNIWPTEPQFSHLKYEFNNNSLLNLRWWAIHLSHHAHWNGIFNIKVTMRSFRSTIQKRGSSLGMILVSPTLLWTLGLVWKHFWLSQLERNCYWPLVGKGQRELLSVLHFTA